MLRSTRLFSSRSVPSALARSTCWGMCSFLGKVEYSGRSRVPRGRVLREHVHSGRHAMVVFQRNLCPWVLARRALTWNDVRAYVLAGSSHSTHALVGSSRRCTLEMVCTSQVPVDVDWRASRAHFQPQRLGAGVLSHDGNSVFAGANGMLSLLRWILRTRSRSTGSWKFSLPCSRGRMRDECSPDY